MIAGEVLQPAVSADVIVLGSGPRAPWVKSGSVSAAEAKAAVERFRSPSGGAPGGRVTVATVLPVGDGFDVVYWVA